MCCVARACSDRTAGAWLCRVTGLQWHVAVSQSLQKGSTCPGAWACCWCAAAGPGQRGCRCLRPAAGSAPRPGSAGAHRAQGCWAAGLSVQLLLLQETGAAGEGLGSFAAARAALALRQQGAAAAGWAPCYAAAAVRCAGCWLQPLLQSLAEPVGLLLGPALACLLQLMAADPLAHPQLRLQAVEPVLAGWALQGPVQA